MFKSKKSYNLINTRFKILKLFLCFVYSQTTRSMVYLYSNHCYVDSFFSDLFLTHSASLAWALRASVKPLTEPCFFHPHHPSCGDQRGVQIEQLSNRISFSSRSPDLGSCSRYTTGYAETMNAITIRMGFIFLLMTYFKSYFAELE